MTHAFDLSYSSATTKRSSCLCGFDSELECRIQLYTALYKLKHVLEYRTICGACELFAVQEYMDEAKSLKVPVRSLLHKKNKAPPSCNFWLSLLAAFFFGEVFFSHFRSLCLRIKKLKNGMKLQPLPDRPESMPSKPPKARRIFFMEKRHLAQCKLCKLSERHSSHWSFTTVRFLHKLTCGSPNQRPSCAVVDVSR